MSLPYTVEEIGWYAAGWAVFSRGVRDYSFYLQVDAVCIVHEAVENGVAEGRIADHLGPPRGLSLLPRKIVGNASFTALLPSFILNSPINVIGEKP
jgi:hypothetical protein